MNTEEKLAKIIQDSYGLGNEITWVQFDELLKKFVICIQDHDKILPIDENAVLIFLSELAKIFDRMNYPIVEKLRTALDVKKQLQTANGAICYQDGRWKVLQDEAFMSKDQKLFSEYWLGLIEPTESFG